MAYTLDEYLQYLGFPAGQNPFASVNARDERAVLEGYFVPPPYFETLWGDPSDPKSAIVLAPTGGGKTALAVMIDERASSTPPLSDGRLPVLTILYDDYSRLGLAENRQGLEHHLTAINYLLTIHLISTVAQAPIPHLSVTSDDRRLLRYCFAKYVGGKAAADVFHDLERLKTPWERLQGTTRKVVQAIPVISLVATALEIGAEKLRAGVELAKAVANFAEETRDLNATPETDFHRLIGFATQYYEAVYILVDRADETSWTQRNPEATYDLVHPLVGNLNLLDYPTRRFAIKFFLWDAIKPFYREHARDDRIFVRDLDWNRNQLVEMLDNRVTAFSSRSLTRIEDIFDTELSFADVMPVSEALAIFAGSSPRAIVTLCKYMVEEQVNLINHEGGALGKIGDKAFLAGLKKYANEVAHRLIPDDRALREITSIGRVVFTSKVLHSEVFRGNSAQSVRSKVGKWKRYDVFKAISNEVTGQRGYPTEIHAFSDACVAFLTVDLPIREFLQNKVRRCQSCSAVLLRDFEKGGRFQCRDCLTTMELPRQTTEAEERRQQSLRTLARECTRAVPDPEDISALSRAAALPFGEETFTGQPFLIWLRILQNLDDTDREALARLLSVLGEVLDEAGIAAVRAIL